MNNLRYKLKDRDNKTLLSNFFSLGLLQMANFILPLISLPYLIRVLGVELFGLITFATSLVMYFIVITDYGFNLSATREVSLNRDSKKELQRIYSSVIIIKLSLALVCLIILSIITISFEKFSSHILLYYLTFGMVIGQILLPTWFFQGVEEMKYITILNVLSKSLFLIMIFIFVNTKDDYYLVPVFTSLGFIISGLIAQFIVFYRYKLRFVLPSINDIKRFLYDGYYIFLSRVSVLLYTSSNIFLLGLFTTNIVVGYYSIAEKIVSAINSLGSVINQAAFPYLTKIWGKDRIEYFDKFRKFLKLETFVLILAAVLLMFLAKTLILILSNEVVDLSINIVRILSITVLLIPLGGMLTQNLVVQEENRLISKITMLTTVLNIILATVMISFFGAYGLAITVVVVQVFQISLNLYYHNKLKNRFLCVV